MESEARSAVNRHWANSDTGSSRRTSSLVCCRYLFCRIPSAASVAGWLGNILPIFSSLGNILQRLNVYRIFIVAAAPQIIKVMVVLLHRRRRRRPSPVQPHRFGPGKWYRLAEQMDGWCSTVMTRKEENRHQLKPTTTVVLSSSRAAACISQKECLWALTMKWGKIEFSFTVIFNLRAVSVTSIQVVPSRQTAVAM